MKTPDYLSYDRYKKKKETNPNKRMLIFVTTFFATLLLFTVVAKGLSPDVDVTIGDESETDAKETGLGVKKFIDERLKMIQMEDNSAGVSMKGEKERRAKAENENSDDFIQEVEEKVSIPVKGNKSEKVEEYEEPLYNTARTAPRPSGRDLSTPFEAPKVSKVYVGRYSSIEQAKVAQEILMDAGLGITPFVRDTGNYYTLQIGSYTNRAKAEGLASELQRNNFPARVVQE